MSRRDRIRKRNRGVVSAAPNDAQVLGTALARRNSLARVCELTAKQPLPAGHPDFNAWINPQPARSPSSTRLPHRSR